jgi:serine/threonine protein kinase
MQLLSTGQKLSTIRCNEFPEITLPVGINLRFWCDKYNSTQIHRNSMTPEFFQPPLSEPIRLTDRYELRQRLGQKVGRRTFLAWDGQRQEQVVIKLLLFGADFDWTSLKLFEREAQTLQSLEHEAIPQYLDWFDAALDGAAGFALVQTYIPAPCLETIVRSGRTFSTKELINIAGQILDILEYLHSRHPAVIHRDLKPSNILLGDRTAHSPGKISLVDFGSVQTLLNTKGGTITIVGTYGYMPMEQFGDRAVPASDLYSLGATMLYLATGKDPADFLEDDAQIQIQDYPAMTPALAHWIEQLMQPKVSDRVASVQIARQLLYQSQEVLVPLASNQQDEKPIARQIPLMARRIAPADSQFQILVQNIGQFEIRYPGRCFRYVESRLSASPMMILIISIQVFMAIGFLMWVIRWLAALNYWAYLLVGLSILGLIAMYQERMDSSTTLAVTSTSININGLTKDFKERRLEKYQAWKIEYGQREEKYFFTSFLHARTNYFIDLAVGDQILTLFGNEAEILWLAGEFSHYLQLPAVEYVPPASPM